MTIQEINFQPMLQWISEQIQIEVELSVEFDGKRPKIVCPNLQEHCGVFRAVVREVEVSFFNFNFDEETGLWATIYLSYESWSGGSNGMQIGTVWYDETGWTFRQEKQMFESQMKKSLY